MNRKKLETIIKRTVETNMNTIKERGTNAFGYLMGIIMRDVRGKADPNTVKELLEIELKVIIND